MKKRITVLTLLVCVLGVGVVYAATVHTMKCQDNDCGYNQPIRLGATMQTNSITGYCRGCDKFVSLSWRYNNLREPGKGIENPPKPLGEIWDSKTGTVTPVYGCPTCKGPFAQIKKHDDLKHCPQCNKAGFSLDTSKPTIAVD